MYTAWKQSNFNSWHHYIVCFGSSMEFCTVDPADLNPYPKSLLFLKVVNCLSNNGSTPGSWSSQATEVTLNGFMLCLFSPPPPPPSRRKKAHHRLFPDCSDIDKSKNYIQQLKSKGGKRKGAYKSLPNVADIKGLQSLQIPYRYLSWFCIIISMTFQIMNKIFPQPSLALSCNGCISFFLFPLCFCWGNAAKLTQCVVLLSTQVWAEPCLLPLGGWWEQDRSRFAALLLLLLTDGYSLACGILFYFSFSRYTSVIT